MIVQTYMSFFDIFSLHLMSLLLTLFYRAKLFIFYDCFRSWIHAATITMCLAMIFYLLSFMRYFSFSFLLLIVFGIIISYMSMFQLSTFFLFLC